MVRRMFLAVALALMLAGCLQPPDPQARILLMGDSLLAANALSGRSVGDALRRQTGQRIADHSTTGASYTHLLPISGAAGMRISAQFRPGPWDWVVLNGGGNDVLLHCGCGKCRRFLDRLISPDGQGGIIPAQVARLRATGAKVAYVGYLRSNGFTSVIEGCAATGDEMDRRLSRMAQADRGVTFIPLADLVPSGDTSYYGADTIHPSAKGSAAIAARIAAVIAP